MTEAAEVFMPLYKVIEKQLPKASVEDTLKVMEAVAKLGHKIRGEKLLKDKEMSLDLIRVKKARKIKINHKKKTVTVFRKLNPPSFHAWMMAKIKKENPDYTILEEYDNT